MTYLDRKPSSSKTNPSIPRTSKPVSIYRRGKPLGSHPPSNSSSSDQSDEDRNHHRPTRPIQSTTGLTPIINLATTSIDRSDPVAPAARIDSDEEDSDDSSSSTPKNLIKSHPGASISPQSSSSSGSSSSSSSDQESDEQDSEKLVPIYKPVFITKFSTPISIAIVDSSYPSSIHRRNRQTIPTDQTQTEAELEAKRLEEEDQRRKASQKLVEATLLREIAEKEVDKVFPDVDDTDGLDPEVEFEAWKLRELKRLRRDREVLIQRAKEKEELEARRMIPESERLKQDLEYAEQTRKAKPRGKQAFLQKYHHKGAFYADSEILKKHDFSAPTEGTFTKMELLPSVMQVRDFGKMSRSKWTHLAKEDTTSFDAGWSQTNLGKGTKVQDGCFSCGERGHMKKDCPKNHDRNPGQGPNRIALGNRDSSNDHNRRHKRRDLDNDADEKDYPSKRREADRDRSRDRSRRSEEPKSRDYSPKQRHAEDDRANHPGQRGKDLDRHERFSKRRDEGVRDHHDHSPRRRDRGRDRYEHSPRRRENDLDRVRDDDHRSDDRYRSRNDGKYVSDKSHHRDHGRGDDRRANEGSGRRNKDQDDHDSDQSRTYRRRRD